MKPTLIFLPPLDLSTGRSASKLDTVPIGDVRLMDMAPLRFTEKNIRIIERKRNNWFHLISTVAFNLLLL